MSQAKMVVVAQHNFLKSALAVRKYKFCAADVLMFNFIILVLKSATDQIQKVVPTHALVRSEQYQYLTILKWNAF